ncbi:MAG TPA: hypothetical protein VFI95_05430 [Terriglobales bacterium]|nr:hypothetical protein [Terriglobales bacterium]
MKFLSESTKDSGIRLMLGSGILISSMLLAWLLAVGCSKEKSTPVSSELKTTPATSSQVMVPATPVSAPSAAQTVAPKPLPKKTARKHLSVVTYKDEKYGISFGYPRKYALKTGEDLKSDSNTVEMNFVQPGGVAAVSVALPDKAYPGTDLSSALLQVNVHNGLTAEQCQLFAVPAAKPDDKNAVKASDVQIGEMNFIEVENITGESTKQVDTKYYHAFQNNACYEFALTLTTEWDGSEDGVGLVDREDVFRRLEKILAGVNIKTETPAPAVASEQPTPTVTESEVRK